MFQRLAFQRVSAPKNVDFSRPNGEELPVQHALSSDGIASTLPVPLPHRAVTTAPPLLEQSLISPLESSPSLIPRHPKSARLASVFPHFVI